MERLHPKFTEAFDLGSSDLDGLRSAVLEYFQSTCAKYESLFELLSCDEAYFERPIPLRHPLIFYFGHTAVFFINKLITGGVISKRVDASLESMLSVGVDEMSWDDLSPARFDWPTVEAVRTHRAKVRTLVEGIIKEAPLEAPITWNSRWWVIIMCIEHERIHLETSSVLIRQHNLKYVKPSHNWEPLRARSAPTESRLVHIPAMTFGLGRDHGETMYGWDNEFGTHDASTSEFDASSKLTSNKDFLEFVEAGGYFDPSFWSEEGAAWRKFSQASHPTFWIKKNDEWFLRLLAEEAPMPWEWPVEVNFHEAEAFCKWKTHRSGLPYRLPTEDEWHAIYKSTIANATVPANIGLNGYNSPCPVSQFNVGGVCDVIGNVWQWTSTPIYPFSGFIVHPAYDDFSTPTFDGRHNIIKGGSWISTGNEAMPYSRYAFRRHFFQHAGFRCIVSQHAAAAPKSLYETDRLLSEYAAFHYGPDLLGVPNFAKALATLASEVARDKPRRRALDLGCGPGRSSFELACYFDEVIGVDYSARLIGLGTQMSERGSISYTITDEGELTSTKECSLADLGLKGVSHKVRFRQGDACNLEQSLSDFDLVLAANLIDRLYSPRAFLLEIGKRITSGGILMIASPYTWMEQHTKREDWIGGFKRDGKNQTTLDGLKEILSPSFALSSEPVDVPFVIRETARKHQYSLSQLSIWTRL